MLIASFPSVGVGLLKGVHIEPKDAVSVIQVEKVLKIYYNIKPIIKHTVCITYLESPKRIDLI